MRKLNKFVFYLKMRITFSNAIGVNLTFYIKEFKQFSNMKKNNQQLSEDEKLEMLFF